MLSWIHSIIERAISHLIYTRQNSWVPAILIEVFLGFTQSLHANYGRVPRLGHDRYLPDLFQFISYPTIRRYTIYILTASLNNSERTRKILKIINNPPTFVVITEINPKCDF
jgi:hypothetical protein